MEKKLVALVLVALLAGLGGGIGLGWILYQRVYVCPYVHVDVGAYYYGWCHAGYKGHGWNDSFDYDPMEDEPFLGYYDSNDARLCKQHIAWMDDLGVDFALISYSANHSAGIDDNIDTMFNVRQNYGRLKFAICVEPFNRTFDAEGHVIHEEYNFTWLHNRILERYCNYSFYYTYQNKPLLTYIGGSYGTNLSKTVPQDNNFTQIVIGGNEGGGREGFQDWCDMWAYTLLTPSRPYKYAPYSDRMWVVTPRYDDWAKRRRNMTVDGDYTEHVYERDWEKALKYAESGEIDIIMICTFNEFHERTAIEPCFDATSFSDNPFYIYNLTKKYISKLKNITSLLLERYNALRVQLNYLRDLIYMLIATTIILITTTVYFAKRKPKS